MGGFAMELNVMAGLKRVVLAAAVLGMVQAALAEVPASRPKPRLVLGEAAPEIQATTLEGKLTSLAALREEGKVLVLQFGSVTEPVFRTHVAAVEKLAEKTAAKATFVLVYQQEAHPADTEAALDINATAGFGISQPLTIGERQKAAAQAVERLKVKQQKVVVDVWSNTSAGRYGSMPNMTFVIDAQGKLQAGYPWMDTAKVAAAIDLLAAGKPLTPDLRGPARAGGPGMGLDYTGISMEMTGGRGPAGLAQVLERIEMTVEQKQAIYPLIGQYFHDLREFRDANERARRPAAAAAAAAATTGPAVKELTAEEAREALMTSAGKLKAGIKEKLAEKDARAMLEALERGQQQRLFKD